MNTLDKETIADHFKSFQAQIRFTIFIVMYCVETWKTIAYQC